MKFNPLFFSLVFLFYSLNVFGSRVNDSTAAAIASNFFNEQLPSTLKAAKIKTKISKTKIEMDNNIPSFYVFNFGDNQGFVIVSAEDAVTPILAYSYEGHFVGASPAVTKWMQSCKSQIKEARNNQQWRRDVSVEWRRYSSTSKLKSAVTPTGPLVGPMLTTTWSQEGYYNDLCSTGDVNHNGADPLVGCVAVAMGQVMKYHGYPSRGRNSKTYTDPAFSKDGCEDPSWGTKTVNFGTTTYNWAGMPNKLTSSNNNIATLLYHCGVSISINYGSYCAGTSGYVEYIPNALVNYFNYYKSAQTVYKTNYTDTQWQQLIKTELDNSRPVVYSGLDPKKENGHAFVCDGYDAASITSFHINWGWDGDDDGWFKILSLTPNSFPSGFSTDMAAVIGIKPVPNPTFTSKISSLCTNQSKLTSINPVPGALSYTWSVTNSLSIMNETSPVSFTGTQTQVSIKSNNAQGFATVTVVANMPGGAVSNPVSYSFWAGVPTIPEYVWGNSVNIAPGEYKFVEILVDNGEPMPTSWNWIGNTWWLTDYLTTTTKDSYVINGTCYLWNKVGVQSGAQYGNTGIMMVKANNVCGSSPQAAINIHFER